MAAQVMRPASDFHCAGLPWKLETSTPRSILLPGRLTMLCSRFITVPPVSMARPYRVILTALTGAGARGGTQRAAGRRLNAGGPAPCHFLAGNRIC